MARPPMTPECTTPRAGGGGGLAPRARGTPAVPGGDDGADAAPDEEVALDLQPAGLQGAHEVVADLVRDPLVEGPLVAEAPEVELQALQLHAELRRHVADADGGEVGLPRERAEAGELRRLHLDLVGAAGIRVGEDLEGPGRLRRHGGGDLARVR